MSGAGTDNQALWQAMSQAHQGGGKDGDPALSAQEEAGGQTQPVRTSTQVTAAYAGTLPDPDKLAAYEAAAPGITAQLLAEDRARARRADRYRTIRLVAALGLAVTTILCGQWALLHGASTEALYLTGGGLAGLIATFLRA
jgi:hypothetical protein